MSETTLTDQQRWDACKRIIQSNVTEQQFLTWFEPIRFVQFSAERNELTVSVPSPFVFEYIEAHFVNLLRTVLHRVYDSGVRLKYKVTTDATNDIAQVVEGTMNNAKPAEPARTTGLNQSPRILQELDSQLKPEYTFENFVQGNANKLPCAVGLSIAQNSKQVTFNPLFIYGHSGVGKTHLVNAIGLRLKALHPEKRVLYISAHLFQVQYTDSIRQNTFNDFINFYQSIDVLIIDDVQEFAFVKGTQQAFFHIFNHLHQNGRQLILTSDRPPVALQGMEERLLTRFKWGLLAELERPDVDLRRDILRRKVQRDGLRISESVIDFIAKNVDKSVRDLEGVINSLMAYSVVLNSEVDVKLAENVIARTIGLSKKHEVTLESIVDQTCSYFGLEREDIMSSSRKANVVQGRQVAMFLAQKYTHLSTTKIGGYIGKRNHATVVHSCQSINERLSIDHAFKAIIEELEALLTN